MIAARNFIPLAVILCLSLVSGCADNTTDMKQKIAELEKRVAKQEKQLAEFEGKFSAPKDFSVDIQRLEDQQDRIAQQVKTKVDPINLKLEEFREWAQEAQGERDKVSEKLKGLDQAVAGVNKRSEAEAAAAVKVVKQMAADRNKLQLHGKVLEEITNGLAQLRKELLDNNTKLIAAVKKTLPKVKEAAVEEIRGRIDPIEKNLLALKSGLESDRKTLETMKTRTPAEAEKDLQALRKKLSEMESGKDVQALRKKLAELEEVLGAQNSFLLEIGSKLHELETAVRGRRMGSGPAPYDLSLR